MTRLFCLLIGYAFGLFQTAYIYGRFNGIDIRKSGSGNAGTTNALRVLGKKAGLIVVVADIGKCITAVFLTRIIFGGQYPEMINLLLIYTAAGAILGHNFPFYLKFRGGKGIAASGGMILSFQGILIPLCAIVFFSTFFASHYVSLASLLLYLTFLLQVIIEGQCSIFGIFDSMPKPALYEMYVIITLLTALAYWQHRGNISRLISGKERKTYIIKGKDAS